MITVRSLHIYPVKSCRGIEVDTAEVVPTGFRHDRQWMVVDADGSFLSQRSHPVLARIGTSIEGDLLILEAPGHQPLEIARGDHPGDRRSVVVWDDACEAVSAGPRAAEWFSSLLGTPCELVRQPDEGVRRVDPVYANPGDRVAFADGFPFLLLNRASVEDLNRRLADPVPADRFRANIVVEGCEAFAEDDWTSLQIGEIRFRVVKPCARCVVISTDQQDGTRSDEPLKTLAGYRRLDGKILFGQNLVHSRSGTLTSGVEVRVVERRPGDIDEAL
ncbi:MAG: MOSC N-terminal beta barrel domain-containing protein [Candidatus Sulfomarinibacteraceae bacterium]